VVDVVDAVYPTAARSSSPAGRFTTHTFDNAAGARTYKVYVPAAPFAAPPAMIVMLHGCTQSADDFAAGTQMNRMADAHGFVVVYPEQSAQANSSRCWNWFKPQDQTRNGGEPSLIAGIAEQVRQRHGVDPQRIFVAGLSAGAAMALVLGQTYPEIFSAVGVHSGLPYGSAHDVPSALAAMKGGRSGMPGLQNAEVQRPSRPEALASAPLIVFHGDRDHTVQHSNAAQIVEQAQRAQAANGAQPALRVQTQRGAGTGGRSFTRTVHTDAQGRSMIEAWTLHGAGHAWSGGHASGSYTDAAGPDASAEMVRFFMATRPGTKP
jgi:poly(hydroxyalkanoate) depolymerase family esterase